MVELNILDLLENASEYALCEKFIPIAPIINTRKVFSFTLFLARPTSVFNDTLSSGLEKPHTLREWIRKYIITQQQKFTQLLNDPNWSDFGIIWFIDAKLVRSKMKLDDSGQTIKQLVNKMTEKFPGRLAVLGFDCSNITDTVWYGSIVRFVPLVTGEFEVVIFRDAHSTIPNPNNRYDRNWYETWYSLSGDEFKKYWLYQMITYNPAHAKGEKVPFAATWSARAELTEDGELLPIMSPELWNGYFGDPEKDPGVYFQDFDTNQDVEQLAPGQYGIDERIFSQLIYETEFLEDSYIVGMTWLAFLFNSEANPRQFSQYSDEGNIIYCAPRSGLHSIRVHTYLTEARCVVYYIAETFGSGWDIKLIDLFKVIASLQSQRPSSKKEILFHNLVGMLPTAEHIWAFLFDTSIIDPYSGMTLSQAVEVFGTTPLNYKNMCAVVGSYFRGGEINYDRYIHNPEYKDIEPYQDIKLPSSHPYKSGNNVSKFLASFC